MGSFFIAVLLVMQMISSTGVAGLDIFDLDQASEAPQSHDNVMIVPREENTRNQVSEATKAGTPKHSEYLGIGESIAQARTVTETIYVTLTTTISVLGAQQSTGPLQDLTSPAPVFSTSVQPTPSSCGEHGDFVLNFDGLPSYSGGGDEVNAAYPPIFNPYRHFYFSEGWGYLNERTSPVIPESSPHVAIFEPGQNDSQTTGSPYAGLLADGNFGAGPRAYDDAFWFNAKSFYFGCNNGANEGPCIVTITGTKYSPNLKAEYPSVSQTYRVEACPETEICVLQQVQLNEELEGITSLGFEATVQDTPVTWYIDDIELSWFNNTCLAGLKRGSSR